MNVKFYRLIVPIFLSVVGVAVALALLPSSPSLAQGGGITVLKQLGRTNPVVFVGEYITFTIDICNETTFTVDVLPLYDDYAEGVLAYQDATYAPSTHDAAAGTLFWNDLTTVAGNLGPGQCMHMIVGFIAANPQTAVVNYAEVQDALNTDGEVIGSDQGGEAPVYPGGSAPVTKTLTDQAGAVVTFTVEVWNNGYVTMTQATLEDTYDPTVLSFYYSVPMPDLPILNDGTLRWQDLTLSTGDIPPHGVVTVTTVFTTIGAISSTITNTARIVAAGDWYSNDVGGGEDEAPITIIDRPATPAPTATPRPSQPTQPSQPSQPAPTATPYPTITPTPFIPLLPETGTPAGAERSVWPVAGLGVIVLAAVALLFKRRAA